MPRFLQIVIHLVVFAVGLPALLLTNFWAWDLLRGLVLPLVATVFLFYLILFVAFDGYRVFQGSTRRF